MSAKAETLDIREQELVAVGVSIAAGCQLCLRYHLRAARAAGVLEEDIRQAMSAALSARQAAAAVMAQLARELLGGDHASAPPQRPAETLLGHLVSIGAAWALNCTSSFNVHLAHARDLGATQGQIVGVLSIARAVKTMAGKRIDAAVARQLNPLELPAEQLLCAAEQGHRSQAAPQACCAEPGGASDACRNDLGANL